MNVRGIAYNGEMETRLTRLEAIIPTLATREDLAHGDRERQGPDLAHRETIGEGWPRGHLRRPACRQRCAQAAGRGGVTVGGATLR